VRRPRRRWPVASAATSPLQERPLTEVAQRMDVVPCWRKEARNALLDRALGAFDDGWMSS
jgi:hypothetical protein